MKIYRGPKSKPFDDDTHEYVDTISPKDLEKGVKSKARITFNITKEGTQREAICTAIFEDADLVPMANGLLARLALQQDCLKAIRAIAINASLADVDKVKKINLALNSLK